MADGNGLHSIRTAIRELPYGKRLPTAVYVADVADDSLPPVLRNVCAELRKRLEINERFNLLKFHTDKPKISFLSYPAFATDPHPALAESVVVDLVTGRARRDDYSGRANPPILHRKESFLPSGHPDEERFSKLTREEEEAGLLDETSRIGFRLNWDKLVAERGFTFCGHRLVAAKEKPPSQKSEIERSGAGAIARHKTAIVRSELSKPLKLLLELNLLRKEDTLFDYGCGHGTDIVGLARLGFRAVGWDPVHAPDRPLQNAAVVNLGFVLNVIEDPAERVEVLQKAWGLSQRLLVVTTLIRGQEAYDDFCCCGDGILTSRNTFQKYFEPAEFLALLEDTLDCEAIPVALGVYLVFRHVSDAQDFLSRRTRRYIDWTTLSHRLGLRQVLRRKQDPYDTHRELLTEFWNAAIGLGRVPRADEFEALDDVRTACGSLPRAMALFIERFGQKTFEAARLRRREDTLVYVAAAKLKKRVPFNRLSVALQRDVQSFFGTYADAEKQALEVMFAAGDVDELALAVQQLGFGWWDEAEQQFTVHRSLLDDLPIILRVYVECAARFFGDPREADLIKFHLRSRKLTFQHYDDFDGAPFPELKMRIKIDLPRMFVTVLEQRHVADRQLLYFKERFVSPQDPRRKRMEQISKRMRRLGFSPSTIGYGPSRDKFAELLQRHGLTWSLVAKPTQQGAESMR